MDKKRYTCWHCRTGIVHRLPATCPECDRRLEKEVKKGERKKRMGMAASAITALLMACAPPNTEDTAVGMYKVNEVCTQQLDGAQYTLQAYASNVYTGITVAISARDVPAAVYIDLNPTNISTYYTADIKFLITTCNSELFFKYRPTT